MEDGPAGFAGAQTRRRVSGRGAADDNTRPAASPPTTRLAFACLVLAGCVTVVVAPSDAAPSASRALARGQRDAEAQQAGLRRDNLDAITETAARIAADVQAWALKPAAFGGGDGDVRGVTFERLGYPTDDSLYVTPHGAFGLAPDGDAVLVHGESRIFGHGVTARVDGTGWRDLSLTVRPR